MTSIVGKINLLFFIIITLSAGAIVSIYLVKLSRDVVVLEEESQRELLSNVNESINMICERSETALDYLLSTQSVQKYISGSFYNDSEHIFSLYDAGEAIASIRYINKDIMEEITFYSVMEEFPEHGNQFHHISFLKEDAQLLSFFESGRTSGWFRNVSNRIYLDSSKEEKKQYTVYARKVMGMEGKIFGVFVIRLRERQLREIIPETDGIYFTDNPLKKQVAVHNSYLSGYVTLRQANRDIGTVVRRNIIVILAITCAGLCIVEWFVQKLIKKIFRNMYHMLGDMERIVEDDLSARLSEDREQELNEIAGKINVLLERIQRNIQAIVELEKQKQRVEVMALQLQMNPHFFYNGLGIVQYALEEMDRYRESTAISHFSWILRYNMTPRVMAVLGEELECVRNYVEFVNAFRNSDWNVVYKVDTGLMTLRIPKFILQPFAENAVKYGDGESLVVCALCEKDTVTLKVKNRGKIPQDVQDAVNRSLKEAYIEENAGKIGLKNIATRLKLFYGKGAEIGIREDMGWVTVWVRIERKLLSMADHVGV